MKGTHLINIKCIYIKICNKTEMD